MDRSGDKSFEGLLFSLALHALLVALTWNLVVPPHIPPGDKTEITILDADDRKVTPKSKAKAFVTETEKKELQLKNLKDTADYLSQFTKRVKKQVVARDNGPTHNSQPSIIPLEPKQSSDQNKVAGLETENKPRGKTTINDQGIGLPPPGGNQGMHQIAIGPSSISEYVPGVEEGDFTALNTDQFTYYAFFARINEQIRNRWVAQIRSHVARISPREQDVLSKYDRQSVVEIVISPAGDFLTSVLHHSSGDQPLDHIAADSIREASPFLNPPRGMIESDGNIHLHYGFMVRFRPSIGRAAY